MLARILILFCVVRTAGNMAWPYLEMPEIYFVTQAIFEAGVMWYAVRKTTEKTERIVLNFFFGLSVYGLLKEIIFNPIKLDLNEYLGFAVGLLFVILQILNNERNRKANEGN